MLLTAQRKCFCLERKACALFMKAYKGAKSKEKKEKSNVFLSPKSLCVSFWKTHSSIKKLKTLSKECDFSVRVQHVECKGTLLLLLTVL